MHVEKKLISTIAIVSLLSIIVLVTQVIGARVVGGSASIISSNGNLLRIDDDDNKVIEIDDDIDDILDDDDNDIIISRNDNRIRVLSDTDLDDEIDLFPVSGEDGDGTVRITERSEDDFDEININVRVEDLDTDEDEIYEVWLIDDETDFELSIGPIDVNNDGDGTLTTNLALVNFDLYDDIVITREPEDDDNPHPSEVVLASDSDIDDIDDINDDNDDIDVIDDIDDIDELDDDDNAVIVVDDDDNTPRIVSTSGISGTMEEHIVSIRGSEYTPEILTIEEGDRVTWVNEEESEDASRTVTSLDVEAFNSGVIEPGGVYTRVFTDSGVYYYYSQGDTDMRGTIIVT